MKKNLLKSLKLVTAGMTMALLVSSCGNQAGTETNTTEQENSEQVESGSETQEAQKEKEAEEYYNQGRNALYGLNGTEISYESALENFMKARELGKTDASFYLGALYDWYGYPERNSETARTYYEECTNNPYAQLSLGFIYYYGQGVQADQEKGMQLFQDVIDQGVIEGYIGYADIADAEQDYAKAIENYNKVIDGTEPLFVAVAMNALGAKCYNGYGVEQDYGKAVEWFEKAANMGNMDAMTNIGNMYDNATGVEQDYTKAMEWYEKASDLGDANAMTNIGAMYVLAEGVEQDYTKAIEWLQKAVDRGNNQAIQYLYRTYCMKYDSGDGTEQDLQKAIELCEQFQESCGDEQKRGEAKAEEDALKERLQE